jgi:hypothetical protein
MLTREMSITDSAVEEESYNFENCPVVRLDGITRKQTETQLDGPKPIRIRAKQMNNDLSHVR